MTTISDLLSPAAVTALANETDPVTRNLRITQSYHLLARALHRHLGPDDITWLALATYASKQAGQVIRADVVPEPLRALVLPPRMRSSQWLRPTTWLRTKPFLRYLQLTVDELGTHIAAGNQQVYARMAPLLARLVALLDGASGTGPDPDAYDALLDAADQASPGDASLRLAFAAYREALGADGKARAEAILLGNVLIAWHEQRQLQPPIRAALDAPFARAFDDPARRLLPWLPLPRFVRRIVGRVLQVVFAPALRGFEAKIRHTITRCFMTLSVPTSELGLGDDIPRLRTGRSFPDVLAALERPDLIELVARFDPTPDSLRRTGAQDWSSLDQRMHFIVDLLRSRQRDGSLLEPPFAERQVPSIARGEVPPGRL